MMPKKPVPDLIRDTERFPDNIMLNLLESITFYGFGSIRSKTGVIWRRIEMTNISRPARTGGQRHFM